MTSYVKKPIIGDSHLKAAWTFEEGAGNKIIDVSGHGITGTTANDPVRQTEDADTYLLFDGTDDIINFGDVLGFEKTEAFSIVTTVLFPAAPTTANTILSKVDDTTFHGFQLVVRGDFANDPIEFEFRGTATFISIDWDHTWIPGKKTEIAITYDGSESSAGINCYVDGILKTNKFVGTEDLNENIANTGSFVIGSHTSTPLSLFNGFLGTTLVFARQLSAGEVKDRYEKGQRKNGFEKFWQLAVQYPPLTASMAASETTPDSFAAIAKVVIGYTAPVYQNTGAFASGQTGITPGLPTSTVEGDFLLLLVESANEAIATPSGWTEAPNSPQFTGGTAVAGGVRLGVFYQFAPASPSAPSIADTGNHTTGQIFRFTGVDPDSIHTIDASAGTSQAANTTFTLPSVTTTRDNCIIALCVANDRDIASTTNLSSWTNANLTDLTERADQTVTTQTGGGIGFATGFKASAGSIGTTTVTNAASNTCALLTLALSGVPIYSEGRVATFAATEGVADSFAATVDVEAKGTLAATETVADTFASTADSEITGTLEVTETTVDTFAATANVTDAGVTATMAAVETVGDSFSGDAHATATATASITETVADTLSVAGTVPIEGDIAIVETVADTFAATGGVGDPERTATFAATEQTADTFAGTADTSATGSVAATETLADAMAAIGNAKITGSATLAEAIADTLAASGGNPNVTPPTLPQIYIDTTYSAPTGTTWNPVDGTELQTALDNCALNDIIILAVGTTYTGNFFLPNKTTGSGWIYIRSSNYSSLPAPGTRVAIADAVNMPIIACPYGDGGNGIQANSNAHHYRFVGIEMKPTTGTFLFNMVDLGSFESSAALQPNNIIFDRCYIHGDPTAGSRRGIAMNGPYMSAIDCYISDFKEVGADSQAIWANSTPGPLKIVNNYLEGAGENVLFGGDYIQVSGQIPSDIEFRRNTLFKPLSWVAESWDVKNLLEFKNGQRILVEGNVLENNWPDAQNGFSVLITPRTSGGIDNWCVTNDITIRYNKFVNLANGFNMAGGDDETGGSVDRTLRTNRIQIRHNTIQVTGNNGADGKIFQMLSYTRAVENLDISHNTGFITGGINQWLCLVDSWPEEAGVYNITPFNFLNNIVSRGDAGLSSYVGEGSVTLNAYFGSYQFQKNAIIGSNMSGSYPADQFWPANIAAVDFVDYNNGNYRLAGTSPYNDAGTDGLDLGADIDALEAAIAGSSSTGTFAAVEGTADSFAATGEPTATGTFSATETATDTFFAVSDANATGTFAATESVADTFSATVDTTDDRTATMAAQEIVADTFAATNVDAKVTASMGATEGVADTFAATMGTPGVTGTMAAQETTPDTFASVGDTKVTGSMGAVESADTFYANAAPEVIVQDTSKQLRICNNNLAENTGIISSITATTAVGNLPVSNLTNSWKATPWRSTTAGTQQRVWIDFTAPQVVSMIAALFTNLTANASISVDLFTNIADSVPVYSSIGFPPFASQASASGILPLQNTYSYGGGSTAVIYFPERTIRRIEIAFTDTTNPAGYIQVGNLVVGKYWKPVLNFERGETVQLIDESKHLRTDGSDLLTDSGNKYRKIGLKLSSMQQTDRTALVNILRSNGISNPVFVSLFPGSSDTAREELYMMQCKLETVNALENPMFDRYGIPINFIEV